MLRPADRWQPLTDRLISELSTDPHWPTLAAAFDRAEGAGNDVGSWLPKLISQRSGSG
jgi:hypothetical protein